MLATKDSLRTGPADSFDDHVFERCAVQFRIRTSLMRFARTYTED